LGWSISYAWGVGRRVRVVRKNIGRRVRVVRKNVDLRIVDLGRVDPVDLGLVDPVVLGLVDLGRVDPLVVDIRIGMAEREKPLRR
jgi:hypothetical protein